jgi:hypothetical protein
MQLSLPKLLLLPCLLLALLSCDQEINSAKDQPLVDYVLVVTDSATAAPLDAVRIRITTITGDTASYTTNLEEGRVQLATVASSRTLLQFTRNGYNSKDSIDTVNAPVDSIFHRPVTRLLRIKMTRLGFVQANRAQFAVVFRNADLERLRKGRVTYTDSLNSEKTVVDVDSDGTVELSGLKVGDNTVKVEHPGYLGQFLKVKIEKLADSVRVPPGTTLTLVPRTSSISGQVNYKTTNGFKPLVDAKVEFILKDSTAYPNRFVTYTSATAGSEGRYVFGEVPALDGEMRFYKNKIASERTLAKPISKEEVLQDGPSATVNLSISSDTVGLPVVDTLPKDTLNPKDTLVFHFTQPVEKLGEPVVRLINLSNRLFTVTKLDTATRRTLKIVQKDDDWQVGKTYQYELTLENAQGEGFTRQGDSSTVIRGTFFVREKADTNTVVVYPQNLRLAFFNSGIDRRFDSLAAETSPKADSSTRFARLKWKNGESGNHVDSLLIWIKDGSAYPSWIQWQSIPGFVDSTTLDFSELYSTSPAKNQHAPFPLRNSITETIQLKVLYKEAGRTLDSETVLPSLKQAMGPQVYAYYGSPAGLDRTIGGNDTIVVTFGTKSEDRGSAISFGTNPPDPKIFLNDAVNSHLKWKWMDGKTGWLMYSYSGSPEGLPGFARFRVDVSDIILGSGPVWQRNRKDALEVE